MAETNSTILGKIWLNGSTGYQQNVPNVTQGNIAQTIEFFQNPGARPYWNEFVDALVNRFGDVVVRSRRWENPLAPYKSGMMMWGNTIEEVAPKLIKPKTYDPNALSLLETNAPEYVSAFHHRDFEWRFDITVNEMELRRAFLSEYGLNNFVNSIMDVPLNSDQLSEYQTMMNLIAEYEAKWGFYKVNAPDVMDEGTGSDPERAARKLLRLVRTYVGRMKFLKTLYNAYGLPVFSEPSDLLLMVTPEVDAALDVDGLATLFHLEKAELQTVKSVVDEFPIEGAQALLTDRSWFQCRDTVYENTSFYNPQTLSTNYYLHHQGIMSVSPMANAVLFTTNTGTGLTTVTVNVVNATLDYATVDGVKPTFAPYGENTQLAVAVTGTVNPEFKGVHVPSGSYLEIVASDKALAPHTFVTNDGLLHVDPNETASKVTVKATLSYIDPSTDVAAQTPITATKEFTLGAGEQDINTLEEDASDTPEIL